MTTLDPSFLLLALCVVNLFVPLLVLVQLSRLNKRAEAVERLLISVASNVSKLPKSE